jgi:heavy metal translocating P-type ATPase
LPVTAPAGAGGPVYCCYGCALVSRIVGRQGEESVRAWTILRLAVGALLAMNVMMISLLLYTRALEPAAAPVFRWVLLALATPAMIILGHPFVAGAVQDGRRGRLSLDTLIALGAAAAYAASAVATVRGTGEIFFDTATMLPTLVTFGKLIEATAKSRTRRLMVELETLLPARALRIGPDGLGEVPAAELRVGDRIRVRPGERFAADGRIVEGATTVEEAAFTGESQPRVCGLGDDVLAGTVNGVGAVVVEARHVGEELFLRRILEMVDAARQRPSASERLADRASAVFVPAVLGLALVAGAVWLWLDGPRQAGFVALAVLVVACPCAMGIAAPLATALAIARAAREGVLVRGGDVMERTGQIRTIFFDKTGTLTAGRPQVRAVQTLDPGTTEDEVLATLAALESGSEHALGRAILSEARRRGVAVGAVRGVHVTVGRGIRGTVNLCGAGLSAVALAEAERDVLAGAPEFVSPGAAAGGALVDGATVVDVAWGGRRRGQVLLVDEVRPDAAEAIRRLREAGIGVVLLSGDRLEAARPVAAAVGIERVEAPRGPDEKIAAIRSAAVAGSAVAMVGDGINDAPALAAADVGMALGAGTDFARQAGHVVLLSDRLDRVAWLVALGRQTRRVIRQNLLWALGYNAVALGAAAAGLLHPLLAALAMVVSSLTVLGNSVRLARFPSHPK